MKNNWVLKKLKLEWRKKKTGTFEHFDKILGLSDKSANKHRFLSFEALCPIKTAGRK